MDGRWQDNDERGSHNEGKSCSPHAREKQAWAVQSWQERGLLSQVTLQHCGTCDRGKADLQEGKTAAEKVPVGILSCHTVDIMLGASRLGGSSAEKDLGVPEEN